MVWKKISVALMLGLPAWLMTLSTASAEPKITRETAVWELTKTVVVDHGQTLQVPADPKAGFPGGTLTTGYTVEARAKSKSGKLVPEGTFLLTLSAFSPNKDLPTQKAGLWHVEGNWTIVDKHAGSQAMKAGHNPYTVAGKIHSSLPFNPLQTRKNWSARATLPMSTAAGRWARGGEGSLTFDAKLEGDLSLPVKLWPAQLGGTEP